MQFHERPPLVDVVEMGAQQTQEKAERGGPRVVIEPQVVVHLLERFVDNTGNGWGIACLDSFSNASVERSNPTRNPAIGVQRAGGRVITPGQDIRQTKPSAGNELLYTITIFYARCKRKGIYVFQLRYVQLDVRAFDVVGVCSNSVVGW